ncbi:MAG: sigma-54 dependent transcriptional regulator [Desulfobacterota bacterium]|nr:sigma-54 dependent transcriptional regulator [Thermodesulfobacteriota bacterium]MDW8002339.1 sigma-54 dependent transcriptional regulator [Deltaproteobacteria bacterium]
MIKVLIADDEKSLVDVYKKKLSKEGMQVFTATTGKDAISIMKNESLDVALLDIKLPDIDGIELLKTFKSLQPTSEAIILTGFGSVETAVKSMKLGAYDYLTKPCKLSELLNVIIKAHEKKRLTEKNLILEEHLSRLKFRDTLVGESEGMKRIKETISLVSKSDAPVLILGETGTGKELVARAIHEKSRRAENPFVVVNASCLQENILESELFGYKKGAFTGANSDKLGLIQIADSGTFFVDEIADMSHAIQAKLLRVLETGSFRRLGDLREITVDVRFISATNKNIEREIEAGRFRQDLFFRLSTFVIEIPPLRQRKEDIPLLVDYFLKFRVKKSEVKSISNDALKALINYDWPGNVRELFNVLERAVLVAGEREEIDLKDLPINLLSSRQSKIFVPELGNNNKLNLKEIEKMHIQRVLELTKGNKSRASKILGISRKKLYNLLKPS